MSNPTATLADNKKANISLGLHVHTFVAQIFKIFLPILFWLHIPLLKCVLYHVLNENM